MITTPRRPRPPRALDDHAGPLPEIELLASWGGRTVRVPYRAGHATSRLVGELRRAH